MKTLIKKKGISMVVLIVIIIIMIILAGAVVMTLDDEDVIDKANTTVLKSDIQTMLDNYQEVYNDVLYRYSGDASLITDADFQNKGIIKDKYITEFTVGKNGLTYIGTDDYVAYIAAQMSVNVN